MDIKPAVNVENVLMNLSDDDGEMPAPRQKAAAFSPYEKQLLSDLVRHNRDVIEAKQSDLGTVKRKQDVWSMITDQFCSDCQTKNRTVKQLQKYWSNAKRSAKKLARKKQALREAEGVNPMIPGISQETERIGAVIPSQMYPLVNGYDCDSDDGGEGEEIVSVVYDMSGSNVTNSVDDGDSSTSCIAKPDVTSAIDEERLRKKRRSALLDMEYEEHKIRMRTLKLQQETETLKRKTARRHLEMMEEQHALKMQILSNELMYASDPSV